MSGHVRLPGWLSCAAGIIGTAATLHHQVDCAQGDVIAWGNAVCISYMLAFISFVSACMVLISLSSQGLRLHRSEHARYDPCLGATRFDWASASVEEETRKYITSHRLSGREGWERVVQCGLIAMFRVHVFG